MTKLLTLIMTIIRKMTDTDQEMGVSDAMAALSNVMPFTINVDRGVDLDLNQLKKSGVFYLTPSVGATQAKNNVPIDGKWWYVLSLYTNPSNSFQLAIPDSADAIYVRTMTSSLWKQWNKI